MKTVWGEQLNPDSVLQEYPRPQLVRESYENLNGLWDYAITKTDARPDRWDGKILVPFSPEAELSGVGKALQPVKVGPFYVAVGASAASAHRRMRSARESLLQRAVCHGACRRLHRVFI